MGKNHDSKSGQNCCIFIVEKSNLEIIRLNKRIELEEININTKFGTLLLYYIEPYIHEALFFFFLLIFWQMLKKYRRSTCAFAQVRSGRQ